jgi:hypothetical protein
MESYSAVGGEAVEGCHRQGGDACLRVVAGWVVEGDLAVSVAGDQDEVPAGSGSSAAGWPW